MPCAVIPQSTLTHCSTKTSTFAQFVVEIYVYNSTLRVAVLLYVARAHTQLPHDNRHWTCKRLPPDSVRDSIRTEISDSQVPSLYTRSFTAGNRASAEEELGVSAPKICDPVRSFAVVDLCNGYKYDSTAVRSPFDYSATSVTTVWCYRNSLYYYYYYYYYYSIHMYIFQESSSNSRRP